MAVPPCPSTGGSTDATRRPVHRLGGHPPVLPRAPEPLPRPGPGRQGAGRRPGRLRRPARPPGPVRVHARAQGRSHVMALGPDLARHEALGRALRAVSPLEPVWSFLSLTEASEYMETVEDARARLVAQGAEDLEERLARTAERLAGQREDRLHPRLPDRAVLAFYPMSKAREPGANWYRLPFEERRELMHGHGRVGRRYTGRVLQLVTGATGLDDFEWGVTLLADDLAAIKEVVYDMRFDEVTASYGRFGPFLVGLTCQPADVPARLGLS